MAAAATYEVIQAQTLASATGSVTFSSFAGYTDLVLIFAGGSVSAGNLQLRFNGDTGGNYCTTTMYGTGSGSGLSGNYPNLSNTYGGVAGSLPFTLTANCIFNIFSYASTGAFKTVTSRYNLAALEMDFNVGLWRNTGAITSLNISSYSGAYLIGSTFTLYGIKAA